MSDHVLPTVRREARRRSGGPGGRGPGDPRLALLLAAVGVLLLNDHVLKAAYGTWWTGKLSDFAGLFAFVLFWGMLFPRARRWIAAVTAAAFVVWKSPLADPVLAAVNAGLPIEIGRVVDWTDALALLVLPFAVRLAGAGPRWPVRRARDFALVGVSLFAFAATSPLPTEPIDQVFETFVYGESYPMDAPREALMAEVLAAGAEVSMTSAYVRARFELHRPDCLAEGNGFVEAWTELEAEDSTSSVLWLEQISYQCVTPTDPAELRALFEQDVVDPVRDSLATD